VIKWSEVTTIKSEPSYDGNYTTVEEIMIAGKVNDEFYINENDLNKWAYLKVQKSHEKLMPKGLNINIVKEHEFSRPIRESLLEQ
jgi:DNA (cytosine-5)-methyltransferase 1